MYSCNVSVPCTWHVDEINGQHCSQSVHVGILHKGFEKHQGKQVMKQRRACIKKLQSQNIKKNWRAGRELMKRKIQKLNQGKTKDAAETQARTRVAKKLNSRRKDWREVTQRANWQTGRGKTQTYGMLRPNAVKISALCEHSIKKKKNDISPWSDCNKWIRWTP